MKKTKFLTVLSTVFMLTACGHDITYSTEWSYDDINHWHAGNCCDEHASERQFEGKHSYGPVQKDANGEYTQCKICQYKKYGSSEGSEDSGSDVEIGKELNGFTSVTTFDDTIEIHTPAQKEYLAYTGDYKTMPTSAYPDGNRLNSNPIQTKNADVDAVKTTITWDYEDHNEDVTYSISLATNPEFTDAYEIKGTNEKSIDVYNLFLGDNYYRVNAYEGDGDPMPSGVYKLTVDSTYPRNLYVGQRMTNCRDMGGRTLPDGGKIKQGLLIRTSGSKFDYGTAIDDEGKRIMLEELKVKTEINLSDNNSYNCNLTGTTVYDTFMDYKNGTPSKHHFSRNTENIKNVFSILAKPESYPVFYHCRIGTDRTGLIAILVNGLLGVPLNMIYQDYLFSNFGNIQNKRQIGKGDEDDITNYMKEIEAVPGANFQEKVYNVLITIGVSKDTINKVMDNLIEGAKPNNDFGQDTVNPNNMTISGTTVTHEDKSSLVARNQPEYAAVMSNGATATATFNITKDGEKALYAYVGNSDQSSTKKIGTSISATIDGSNISIPDLTFKDAGLGNCKNSRTNYYFVKIGDLGDLSVGEHTVVITGLANNLILGNLAIVG